MFTNKKDPLVDSVRKVMEQNELRRRVESALNEELGISSRNALPHEQRVRYDAALEEAYKCAMKEEEGSTPRNEKEAKLAAMKEPRHKITHADVLKGRGVIKQEETQLDEKITKSMSAGDVISDFVHSKNPKFEGKSKKERMKMALGAYYSKHPEKSKKMDEEQLNELSPQTLASYTDKAQKDVRKRMSGWTLPASERKNKFQNTVPQREAGIKLAQTKLVKSAMKESVESIMEEIRTNLEEQLVSIYESGDEQMFEEFVSSLTEEQLEILGLNEALPAIYGAGMLASRVAATPAGQRAIGAAVGMGQRAIGAARNFFSGSRGTPPPAYGGTLKSTPSPAPLALPKPSGTAVTTRPTVPTPTTSATTRTPTVPSRTSGASPSTGKGSGIATGATIAAGSAANLATSATPANPTDDNDPGGRSYDAADDNDPGGRSYDAAPAAKPAAKPAAPAARQATPAVRSKPSIERTPDLDKPNTVGRGFSRRQGAELGFTSFDESSHIKESLESFIRNKFITESRKG